MKMSSIWKEFENSFGKQIGLKKTAMCGMEHKADDSDVDLAKKSTDSDELDTLAKSKTVAVRMEVAKNESTSSETLKTLSEDTDEGIRKEVAKNPNAFSEVLRGLSGKADVAIAHVLSTLLKLSNVIDESAIQKRSSLSFAVSKVLDDTAEKIIAIAKKHKA